MGPSRPPQKLRHKPLARDAAVATFQHADSRGNSDMPNSPWIHERQAGVATTSTSRSRRGAAVRRDRAGSRRELRVRAGAMV